MADRNIFTGLDKNVSVGMKWSGERLAKAARNATPEVLFKAGAIIARRTRENLAPHFDTGKTVRRIRVKRIPDGAAIVGPPHIVPLELGHDTVVGGKKGKGGKVVGDVPAYPVVIPAVDSTRAEVGTILENGYRKMFTEVPKDRR
ncbi:hypothetical protein LCGC14_2019900 [marine sediment metagenome]|uniref:Uncharacterized protein n=1 Tax=marine sediment metagenome TaxID=412755 RepID=A0A0F9HUY5_9ZZZZ